MALEIENGEIAKKKLPVTLVIQWPAVYK